MTNKITTEQPFQFLNGSHFFPIETLGAGTSTNQFLHMSFVFPKHIFSDLVSTCPLNG
jgi:hypothetical protein